MAAVPVDHKVMVMASVPWGASGMPAIERASVIILSSNVSVCRLTISEPVLPVIVVETSAEGRLATIINKPRRQGSGNQSALRNTRRYCFCTWTQRRKGNKHTSGFNPNTNVQSTNNRLITVNYKFSPDFHRAKFQNGKMTHSVSKDDSP